MSLSTPPKPPLMRRGHEDEITRELPVKGPTRNPVTPGTWTASASSHPPRVLGPEEGQWAELCREGRAAWSPRALRGCSASPTPTTDSAFCLHTGSICHEGSTAQQSSQALSAPFALQMKPSENYGTLGSAPSPTCCLIQSSCAQGTVLRWQGRPQSARCWPDRVALAGGAGLRAGQDPNCKYLTSKSLSIPTCKVEAETEPSSGSRREGSMRRYM